ncbi:GspH/FimT family pseudopilin [Microbulbifer sp. JSM ZJ756]|uniref:GspH/FimT family pseudopilin n=1 Tax=Microbulbifer sp. JSM ZJ756 TaxID=3376191 RepID=UPI00379208FE
MRQHQRGFTLLELMITVAIIAIVAAMAAPSFNNQISNNRSVALGEELTSALNVARSEAVRRGTRVSLCASADGATCSNSWSDGWIVVVDNATSDTANAVTVGEVLRRWEAPSANAAINVQQNGGATGFVRFNRLGILGRADSGEVTVNASVSGCTGNAARNITVGIAGLLNVAHGDCS